MADKRTRGGYRGRKIEIARKLNQNDPHDSDLWELTGLTNGIQDRIADEFFDQLDKINADDTLTDKGKQTKAKPELVNSILAREDMSRFARHLKRIGERARKLEAKLLQYSDAPANETAAQAVAREFRTNRLIERYERLDQSGKRAFRRTALEKNNLAAMSAVVNDPGLLNADEARPLEVALMKAGDPEAFHQLEELLGKVGPDGQRDPVTGSLVIAQHTFDTFVRMMKREAGIEPTLGDLLAEAGHSLTETDHAIVLAREAAKNPQIFRAAQAEAERTGKTLSVEND